jgi:hypothetical protein
MSDAIAPRTFGKAPIDELYEPGNTQWNIPGLRTLLDELLRNNEASPGKMGSPVKGNPRLPAETDGSRVRITLRERLNLASDCTCRMGRLGVAVRS